MKKIPTLFEREFKNHKVVVIHPKVTPGLEYVLEDESVIATIKFDGSCCAIINGELYKRYDAKKGRKAPEGAIPCCDPDPITGHHPHWVKCDINNPADKWFIKAYDNSWMSKRDGTYEAIGPHFNGNPYSLKDDILIEHGFFWVPYSDLSKLSFETIKKYLESHDVEGIVFWKDKKPVCKIKRTDFGFKWPIKRNEGDKMKLTDDEKLLYDSCEEYVKITILKKMSSSKYDTSNIECAGDDNILELCNRCPFYNPIFPESQN